LSEALVEVLLEHLVPEAELRNAVFAQAAATFLADEPVSSFKFPRQAFQQLAFCNILHATNNLRSEGLALDTGNRQYLLELCLEPVDAFLDHTFDSRR